MSLRRLIIYIIVSEYKKNNKNVTIVFSYKISVTKLNFCVLLEFLLIGANSFFKELTHFERAKNLVGMIK